MALLDLLFFPIILVSVLAITVPLTGVLVRFRASYNPKGLALDAEGAAQPFTGPVVNSYFAMMKRVYRIEGVPGLYKGLMPTLITSTIVFVFVFFALGVTGVSNTHGYDAPQTGVIGTFIYSVFYALLGLPALVITYRSIITPYRLPAFNPVLALRVLLTPTERRRPWIIYATPGLLAAQILHIAYVVLILHSLLRVAGMGDFYKPARGERPESIAWWQATLWIVVSFASTIVLTPLEVISTRLAIQRNHASAEYNSVAQEVDGDEEPAEYYGDSEDVIGLRADSDPYIGLVDCGRRIIEEEGLRALYRGWWITLLGGLAKA